MTDQQPDTPFDPDAAGRVQAFADLWLVPGRNTIERIHADRAYELQATDLLEVLRQLAYARGEALQLAEKCAAWRGQYEDTRAKLEAELTPEPPATDVVQLVIPRGPMLDGLQKVLRALNCTMAGPLPLEREPIPTYVLQPLALEEPTP